MAVLVGALSALKTWRPDITPTDAERVLNETATPSASGRALNVDAAFRLAGLESVVAPQATATPSPSPAAAPDPPTRVTPDCNKSLPRLTKPKLTAQLNGQGKRRTLTIDARNRPPGIRLAVRVFGARSGPETHRVATRALSATTLRLRLASWTRVAAVFTDPLHRSRQSKLGDSRASSMRLILILVALAIIGALRSATSRRDDLSELNLAGSQPASVFRWTNSSSGTFKARTDCPPLQECCLSGVFAAPRANTATPGGESATWARKRTQTVSRFGGLTYIAQLVRSAALGKFAFEPPRARFSKSCEIKEAECRRGDPSGDSATAYADMSTQAVTFTIECAPEPAASFVHGPAERPKLGSRSMTPSFASKILSPTPAPLSTSLLGPGWHAGSERVEVSATDASGVAQIELRAGDVVFGRQTQTCDYSRMQPCPPNAKGSFTVDTSKLADGTYELKATAVDAARQEGVTAGVLRVDANAPAAPSQLAIARNPDGTYGLSWVNPGQGTASPIVGARVQVCAVGGCDEPRVLSARDVSRLESIALPAGQRTIKVWLEDEAGHVDSGNAATLTVDPASLNATEPVAVLPPVLLPDGPAPSSGLRVTRARRSGAILTLSGTIARTATATITTDVSRKNGSASLAAAKTKPKKGKWSMRVRLTPGLRHASSFSIAVSYAGQQAFRKTTLHRRLAKKKLRQGDTATEFSVEARAAD